MRTLPPFVFVIDTDSYSGNFEREMCAYITGQIGECEVGKEQAQVSKKELLKDHHQWFESYVAQVSDNGCYRPCDVWDTQGVAIFFSEKPTAEIIELMKTRARSYKWGPMKVRGFRLIERRVVTTEESV